MGDRSLVQTPPPTMRGGVLEPLEPVGRDNCLPLQAVIVKNGKIFIDSIDALDDGSNDENKRLEEEIDRLTGGDDDDDDYMDNSKFSQEAFDSFMRASDNDDDIGDIMIYNQLHQPSVAAAAAADDGEGNGEADYQQLHYVKYEYHERETSGEHPDLDVHDLHHSLTLGRGSPVNNGHFGPDGGHPSIPRTSGFRRRDSLSLEEYSTFDDDVDRLLSEDLDTSWRYVPLYPENYYSSGQEVQRVSVITDLPNLLRDNNAECMRRVVPKVREVLHVANMDMQLAAATAFLQILERKLVTVEEYKKTFLQTILTSVDNKNEDVANAWLETLLSCIDLLPKDVVKKDVLSIAVNKGQLSQTLQARLSCCKILGKVSSKFENFVVKNDVLPVVLSLCGDVEYDVRACMCQRLDVVAHGLGLELTKSKLLPQLIELSEDESQSVICACLETTTNIIGMLDREANVNAIIPMVKELLEKAMNHVDSTLPVASKLFGRLCHSLLEYMTGEDKSYFQEYFKKLCRMGMLEKKSKEETAKLLEALDVFEMTTDMSTDTRRNAAYNFPAMVLFTGAKQFRSELYPCFSQLCRDPHVVVRKTMAAGFHEVAGLLGTNVSIIFPELITLLNDTDISVLKAVIPNFQGIMSPLAAQGVDHFTDSRAHAVLDVVSNFLKAESIVFNSPCWRTQEALLKSMQSLHQLCHNEFIYTRVLPLLLDKLRHGRALPVKVTAAKTLTILTRHLRYKAQREEVIHTLIEEFHHSESCYRRSLFIDLARCFLEVNSKQAFKDYFYEHVLNMKSDRVATVRLKMLTLFPEMKRSLKLPRDQVLRTALDTVLRQIIVYDKDNDVQHSSHQISEELVMILEGMDSTRTNRRNLTPEEEEDLNREDEERELIAREEKEEKKEEEAKLMKGSEKRNSVTGGKKGDAAAATSTAQTKIPASKKGLTSMKVVQQATSGSKGDGPHQMTAKKGPNPAVTSGNCTTKVVNGLSTETQRSLCLTKSKSTTCIPSLIPRLEPRPSTPPKKDPVRRIPVLVTNKTASSPAIPGTPVTKKSTSPTPSKKSQVNASVTGLSPGGAALTTRRGSATSLSSTTLARRSSMGNANSTSSDTSVKIKVATTPAAAATRTTSNASRVLKKPSK